MQKSYNNPFDCLFSGKDDKCGRFEELWKILWPNFPQACSSILQRKVRSHVENNIKCSFYEAINEYPRK